MNWLKKSALTMEREWSIIYMPKYIIFHSTVVWYCWKISHLALNNNHSSLHVHKAINLLVWALTNLIKYSYTVFWQITSAALLLLSFYIENHYSLFFFEIQTSIDLNIIKYDFYSSIPDYIKFSQFQEKVLPNGSHVFLTALMDGRVLYDSLHNRTHPIGSLRNDVTYSAFYDYMNCLQVILCHST